MTSPESLRRVGPLQFQLLITDPVPWSVGLEKSEFWLPPECPFLQITIQGQTRMGILPPVFKSKFTE